MPTLGRLLISHITLRGPELQQVYGAIAAAPGIEYGALARYFVALPIRESQYGLEEAVLREIIDFLVGVGMLAQVGANRRKAQFYPTPAMTGLDFRLLLLHQLANHPDLRQQAISLVHRTLVLEDRLSVTQADLRELMEGGSYGGLFSWTGEKIAFCGQLLSYIGLLRRLERYPELLAVPQPTLLAAVLTWVGSTGAGASIDNQLRLVDRTFFACFTHRGRVHQGLVHTILTLERLGEIQLLHHTDAAGSLLLGNRRVSELRLLNSTRGES